MTPTRAAALAAQARAIAEELDSYASGAAGGASE